MRLRSHTRNQSAIDLQTSYAILGATGATGGSILEILLRDPSNKLRAFVRSKKRLLSQRSALDDNQNVSIYEAPLSDVEQLKKCMAGCKAVFLCVGTNENVPHCDVAQQQARAVVKALEILRNESSIMPIPKLIVLSSASLEKDLVRDIPVFGQKVLETMSSWSYADLRKAEHFLRSHESWIRQIYIKPGGLVHDQPRGHVLNLDRQETFTSYMDLAAGMIDVADADSHVWDGKNVSVVPASKGTRFPLGVFYVMMKGCLYHFLPGLYPYLSPWL